jgi:streptogrisin C
MKHFWLVTSLSLVIGTLLTTGPLAAPSAGAGASRSRDQQQGRDIGLVAKAKGWTIEEAQAQFKAAEAVGAIAEQIAKQRPDAFVGSALSEKPGRPPTLYVKGSADTLIRQLVASSDIPIVVADNEPFSFEQLEARKRRVHAALEAMGFQDVVTRVNITGHGRIPAEVAARAGAPNQVAPILASLPVDLQSSVDVSISPQRFGADTTSFGGMMVRKSGVNDATSGFSVTKITTGYTGVTTAGHAAGEDSLVHPGHNVVHTFVFQSEHRGQWGDIEWHTTNFVEEPKYYAEAGNLIDTVFGLEARANISVGESVCQYGRFSNDRDCSLDVADVSIACTNNNVWNDRLVQMNGVTTIPGDSGGPWTFGGTVFGSQKGHCGSLGRDAWSVADLFDEAIGVRVNIAPLS